MEIHKLWKWLVDSLQHSDVIKWKYFPCYWPFVRGIHQSPVNSPHKVLWRGTLMFSLICAWANGWVNYHYVGDLIRHCAHDDVTVMKASITPVRRHSMVYKWRYGHRIIYSKEAEKSATHWFLYSCRVYLLSSITLYGMHSQVFTWILVTWTGASNRKFYGINRITRPWYLITHLPLVTPFGVIEYGQYQVISSNLSIQVISSNLSIH